MRQGHTGQGACERAGREAGAARRSTVRERGATCEREGREGCAREGARERRHEAVCVQEGVREDAREGARGRVREGRVHGAGRKRGHVRQGV